MLGQDKRFVKYLEYGHFEEGKKISEVLLANFIKYENYIESLQRFSWGTILYFSVKAHHSMHCIRSHCKHKTHTFSVLNSLTGNFNGCKEYGKV